MTSDDITFFRDRISKIRARHDMRNELSYPELGSAPRSIEPDERSAVRPLEAAAGAHLPPAAGQPAATRPPTSPSRHPARGSRVSALPLHCAGHGMHWRSRAHAITLTAEVGAVTQCGWEPAHARAYARCTRTARAPGKIPHRHFTFGSSYVSS